MNLANVADQPGSWKFIGGRSFEGAGAGLSTSGDLDGDDVTGLLVGADAAARTWSRSRICRPWTRRTAAKTA